jgi:hypothetical protein
VDQGTEVNAVGGGESLWSYRGRVWSVGEVVDGGGEEVVDSASQTSSSSMLVSSF